MGKALQNGARVRGGSLPVRRRIAGITLTEVLVAIAIVSILASIAAPSFSNLIARQRVRASATELYLALVKARSEAIKRNTNVTLGKKGDNWQDGWEILDPSDSNRKLEDRNAISNLTITGPSSVVYQVTGRVRAAATPEFDFSVSGTDAAACVKVDLSGLPIQKSSPC